MNVILWQRVGTALALSFWLAVSMYFGVGGLTKLENRNMIRSQVPAVDTVQVVYQGVPFANQERLIEYLENEQINTVFPWLNLVPSYCAYLITACSFGLLGGVIRLLIDRIKDGIPLEHLRWFSIPILGMVTGIVVLGISFLLPSLFSREDANVKSTALMFFCLFGGMHATALYDSISKRFTTIITTDETPR